jgi:hypothetical protein
MNNTNRALNRIGILILGLLLLVVGAAVATAAAIPAWLEAWFTGSRGVQDRTDDLLADTALADSGQSWLLVVLALVCTIGIVLLVVSVIRQGHGHTRALVHDTVEPTDTTSGGTVTVDGRVAEQAIQQALAGHPGLVSSSVSTYLVRKTPTLAITTTVRRGVSPRDVREFVEEKVAALDALLGREVPVVIQINSGLASRVSRPARFAPQEQKAQAAPPRPSAVPATRVETATDQAPR